MSGSFHRSLRQNRCFSMQFERPTRRYKWDEDGACCSLYCHCALESRHHVLTEDDVKAQDTHTLHGPFLSSACASRQIPGHTDIAAGSPRSHSHSALLGGKASQTGLRRARYRWSSVGSEAVRSGPLDCRCTDRGRQNGSSHSVRLFLCCPPSIHFRNRVSVTACRAQSPSRLTSC